MTVRVGELTSQIEVRAPGGGSPEAGGGDGAGGTLLPTWAERERHRRLVEAERCDRERVAGGGFDA
jgi:hypothetical protein